MSRWAALRRPAEPAGDEMLPFDLQFHAGMFSHLLMATALGWLVGYERERVGKPAGVRARYGGARRRALHRRVGRWVQHGDPARVAAQVVTGVGFLGAGAILRMRGSAFLPWRSQGEHGSPSMMCPFLCAARASLHRLATRVQPPANAL